MKQRMPLVDGNGVRHGAAKFKTMLVESPDAYKERTAWMVPYLAGKLKVSNIIWVIRSRLAFGFNGSSSPALGAPRGDAEFGVYTESSARGAPRH